MRMDAPQGLLGLLASNTETRAVLQYEPENGPVLSFGALHLVKPWTACVFVHDAHVWVHHPQMTQALGWRLER
jgi:hypothetical protein